MDVDRLIFGIVQRQDADEIIAALNQASLAVTLIASTGVFLRTSNVTLLVGLAARDVEKAMDLFKVHSHRRTVHEPRETVVGATLFVLPVQRFLRLCPGKPTIDSRADASASPLVMIITIVSQVQSDQIVRTLTDWSYRATLVSTTGAFFRRRNATLIIGARAERVDSIVEQIRRICEESPNGDSTATVFVLDSPQFERI